MVTLTSLLKTKRMVILKTTISTSKWSLMILDLWEVSFIVKGSPFMKYFGFKEFSFR